MSLETKIDCVLSGGMIGASLMLMVVLVASEIYDRHGRHIKAFWNWLRNEQEQT